MFKILSLEYHTFNEVEDPVQTEKNIFNLMIQNHQNLPEGFGYIGIPLANLINKKGITYTQNIINNIENKFPNIRKKYVCQHILVKQLNFYNNTVFTPHTLSNDSYKCISHYNSLFDKGDYILCKQRKFKFSFMGCFNTHISRVVLSKFNTKESPVINTGDWHYYKNKEEQELFKSQYKQTLSNSIFSLCPPGTGVSTIRLYESMSVGAIPILFNDVKIPEYIKKFCVFSSVENLLEDIENYQHNLEYVSQEIFEYYWKNLDNNSIIEYILKNV